MKENFGLKIISALVGTFSFVILCIASTLLFNSIIFSHYRGMDISFLLFSGMIVTCITAFFSNQILSFSRHKSLLKRLLIYLLVSSFICLVFIAFTGIINEFTRTGRINLSIILKVPASNIFYCLLIGLTLQYLLLSKFTKDTNQKSNRTLLTINILSLPFIALFLYILLNFQSLYKVYSNLPEGQIVLIPTNMERHHIRIFYEEEGGINLPIENDSLLFEIPKNGLLIVKNKLPKNDNGRAFYSLNDQGEREEINRSSYRIVHGYNSRDGGYDHEFSPENGILPPDSICYENFYIKLENINEELFFERYLEENKIDKSDYFFDKSDYLRDYRKMRKIQFDSVTVRVINESRE